MEIEMTNFLIGIIMHRWKNLTLVNFVPLSLKLHNSSEIVCIDGDVEDLVALFEEIARNGETLGHEDLNCADNSGRVSFKKLFLVKDLNVQPGKCNEG